MLAKRQENLLKLIVENYIATAEPIGSKFLVQAEKLDVSGATVRNEMRDLEEAGFLRHPHTSAGRIPTAEGYQYYIENIMKLGELSQKETKNLQLTIDSVSEYREQTKAVAKLTAELTDCAVIVAFQKKNLYYTGIARLFSQPEFRDFAETVRISAVFDQCEDKLDELYKITDSGQTKILLGKNNPFGLACGLITTRINKSDVFSILGPLRMDYAKGMGLVERVRSQLSSRSAGWRTRDPF